MSINLPYIEGTREKLRAILGSHKVRFTFYTEITLRKLLCKPRDRVATEVRKRSFMKLTVVTVFKIMFRWTKRSAKSSNCEKNEIPKQSFEEDDNFSWDQKKVDYREAG